MASRSTLSRAVTSRFKRHQLQVRTSLKDLDVCHVNSDMWTSTANDAYGSFVVSFISSGWELETCVLRCCIVEGRHTALAIAAFLLQIARNFGLSSKIGVVRTDGASNCVADGGVLGDVGGRQDLEAGHVEGADGLAMGLEIGGDCGGAAAVRGGAAASASASTTARGSSSLDGADAAHGVAGGGAGPEFDSDDDEGGAGDDLPDVGSDREDGAGGGGAADQSREMSTGGEHESAAATDVRAGAFCAEIPAALHGGAWLAGGATSASSLTWQHARCATHTLQLSVRAGLSIPLVRTILAKVRLVSKLCRKSTNFQREMSVAVDVKEAGAALRDGRERIPAANLVSRLIVDCPTRWGSTLAMVRRFLRVGPAVPSALSAYYQ